MEANEAANSPGRDADGSWMRAAIDHLASMGSNVFIYGLIVIGTFAALIAGAGLTAAIAGLGFAMIYVFYTERLATLAFQRRFHEVTDEAGERAMKIILRRTTLDEKAFLDDIHQDANDVNKAKERNEDD